MSQEWERGMVINMHKKEQKQMGNYTGIVL
jgi:hypothetical protein